MILTVEWQAEQQELDIVCDDEGLELLLDKLQKLKKGGGHTHLMTPSWAGDELTEGKQTEHGARMNRVRSVKRCAGCVRGWPRFLNRWAAGPGGRRLGVEPLVASPHRFKNRGHPRLSRRSVVWSEPPSSPSSCSGRPSSCSRPGSPRSGGPRT